MKVIRGRYNGVLSNLCISIHTHEESKLIGMFCIIPYIYISYTLVLAICGKVRNIVMRAQFWHMAADGGTIMPHIAPERAGSGDIKKQIPGTLKMDF